MYVNFSLAAFIELPLKYSIICLDAFGRKTAFVENGIGCIKPATFVHNRCLNPLCSRHSHKCLFVNLNIFDYYLGIVDHFRKGL